MARFRTVSLWINDNFFLLVFLFTGLLAVIGNYAGVMAVLLAAALGFAVRHLVRDPRPKERKINTRYDDFGFPSGHAATSAAFALSLASTELFAPAAALCVLIALTRLSIKAHTWPQVTGGVLFGAAVAIATGATTANAF